MKEKIIIGTRGSQLALWQAEKVKSSLLNAFPTLIVEIKIIKTKGDKILDVALSKIGDKGLFTKELEVALLNKSIDVAVHSLKDLPTSFPTGLSLGAILQRGEYRDAIVSFEGKALADLTPDDVIATSSLRRKAGLLSINPNFNIVDIRGNVNTRLEKMKNGHCTAMIMAAAGLQRLGLDQYITEVLEPETLVPAVGQGAVAVEMREGDAATQALLDVINDATTVTAVSAERTFLATLEGGCQVPVGCYSVLDNESITLHGFVASTDGQTVIRTSVEGSQLSPHKCGKNLAEKMTKMGAADILDSIRK